jgi:putative PIN family toxin of toxin-antitoxin system
MMNKFFVFDTNSLISSALIRTSISKLLNPEISLSDCRDPKDNKFLELAICANASCMITGDKDLLILHPFRGIPILNATDFIKEF